MPYKNRVECDYSLLTLIKLHIHQAKTNPQWGKY